MRPKQAAKDSMRQSFKAEQLQQQALDAPLRESRNNYNNMKASAVTQTSLKETLTQRSSDDNDGK